MMAFEIRPTPLAADVRPVEIPIKADGRKYTYQMIFDGGASIAYADDLQGLCAALLPGYAEVSDEPTRFAMRLRFMSAAQVQVQAAILVEMESLLADCTPEERNILGESRATVPVGAIWAAPVPIVLIATAYQPITDVPRPVGQPRLGGAPDSNIIWLDPVSEVTFLDGLNAVGIVSIGKLPDEAAQVAGQEFLAPFHPYHPQRGTGIEWYPGEARLWVQGQVQATARHRAATAQEFWGSLMFADAFPTVTHWWANSAWTGRYLITADEAQLADPEATELTGTLRFVDDEEPDQPWTARQGDDGIWQIDVPLPLLESDTNLALRLALAQRVYDLITGDRPAPAVTSAEEWPVISSVVRRENLDRAFAAEVTAWRLADMDESPRAALLRSLGLSAALNGE